MTYPKVLSEAITLDALVNGGKSIARFGDGEFNLVQGKKCVPQKADTGICYELRNILKNNNSDCIVGIPYLPSAMPVEKKNSWSRWMTSYEKYLNNSVYGSAFITRPDSAPWINTDDYYSAMQSLWQGKEVVCVWGGRRSLYPDFLRQTGAALVHSVLCSYEDAYAQIDYLERAVLATGAKIAILCAGPTATCLAWRLSEQGIQALDLGHIGQFWRQGTPAIPSLSPSNVLPAVQLTKAAIKQWGACSQGSKGLHAAIWWPDYDTNPAGNFARYFDKLRWVNAIKPEKHKRKNSSVVVANAHCGVIADVLAKSFTRVYAFEPDFGLFGSLRRNIAQDCRNIFFYKEALGDKVGIIRLMPSTTPGSWYKADNGTVTVLQVTIDSMELDACDAIVIDGMVDPREILDGAHKTIARFDPIIYVSPDLQKCLN